MRASLTEKTYCTSASVPYGAVVQLHCKTLYRGTPPRRVYALALDLFKGFEVRLGIAHRFGGLYPAFSAAAASA